MNYSLSDDDIKYLLDDDVTIITNSDLNDINNLEELFIDHGCVIILFETKTNSGHWTLLISLPDRLEFFDSYGMKPDSELNYIDYQFRINSNQVYPKLLELLANDVRSVYYNEYQFQAMMKDVNTCGRWCVVRAWNYFMTDQEFKEYVDKESIKSNLPYDIWVVSITDIV